MKTPLSLILALILLGCDSSNQQDQENTSIQSLKHDLYAMQPVKYTWPENIGTVAVIAKNPLAVNYYIVFDGSGSMDDSDCADGNRKVDVAKVSVSHFIQQLPKDANVGLYVFDIEGPREVVPLTADHEKVREQIALVRANGGTPLRKAVDAGYQALTAQARTQLGYGEYHLVIVTDGEANSGQDPEGVVIDTLQRSPVQIHTVGFCIGTGHSLNVPGMTFYASANNPEQLRASLSEVLAEAPDFVIQEFPLGDTP